MRNTNILLTIIFVFALCCNAFADRDLSRSEVLQIFQQLTNQPVKTWINSGTIEATHLEYKAPKTTDVTDVTNKINQKIADYQTKISALGLAEADEVQNMEMNAIPFNVRYELSNESTMNTSVIVKYDGSRFYWEINVINRSDSVKPDLSLKGNFMTNEFNMKGNARRIYSWDGQDYTLYALPVNQASIYSGNSLPHSVNGPLTAGMIPWGNGAFSYENLSAADVNATEVSTSSGTQINLVIKKSNGTEFNLTLDPAKNYAATNFVRTTANRITLQQYSNYSLAGGRWVPGTISIERYDAASSRLVSRDQWQITSINTVSPADEAFKVQYETAAVIDYFKSNIRTAVCKSKEAIKGNCATSAIRTVAARLGKTIDDKQLEKLVSKDNDTNLLAMREFFKGLGLNCQAVTTDLQSLKNLNCQAILHQADRDHFVVLDGFDKQIARTIDPVTKHVSAKIDNNKYTALLISDKPFEKQFASLTDSKIQTIFGAGYSCTKVIQQESWDSCDPPVEGDCDGSYTYYNGLLGCMYSPSGACSTSNLIRTMTDICILVDIDICSSPGDFTFYYMRSCGYIQ